MSVHGILIVSNNNIKELGKVEARSLVTAGRTLPATLERSPGTVTDLKVDLNIVVDPWQKQVVHNQAAPTPQIVTNLSPQSKPEKNLGFNGNRVLI